MFTRAFPLLFVAAMAISAGGQPPDSNGDKSERPSPAYTAFPDLKAPAEGKAVELPPLTTEPADAAPLQKVRFAQLKEGLAYLAVLERAMRVGGPSEYDFERNVKMAMDVHRLAAELEPTPARKAAWYEVNIRYLKEVERYTRLRVEAGALRPQVLNAAAFARLEAEADLLKLKAAGEKGAAPPAGAGVPPGPAVAPPVVVLPTVVTAPCVRASGAVGTRLIRRR